MATSAQIIAAQADEQLRARFVALAAAAGVPSPDHWVQLNMYALVAADLDGEGGNDDSVATVYDYAVATHNPTPPPGVNPAAVTDTHIAAAIAQIRTSEQP